jgi:hypothetical protein
MVRSAPFGKRGSLVFAIRDAEPVSAALKSEKAMSPSETRRLHKECSLDKERRSTAWHSIPSGDRPIGGLSPPPLFDWGADP